MSQKSSEIGEAGEEQTVKGCEFMIRALDIFLGVVRMVTSWRLFSLLMRSDYYHLFPSLCLVMSRRLLSADPYPGWDVLGGLRGEWHNPVYLLERPLWWFCGE